MLKSAKHSHHICSSYYYQHSSRLNSKHSFQNQSLSLSLSNMGNCMIKHRKSAAEIAPTTSDYHNNHRPIIKLSGSPTSFLTSYLRFALHFKPVSLIFIPSDSHIDAYDLRLQCGSDAVTGSPDTLIRYVEARFPDPPLIRRSARFEEMTPVIVTVTALQHRSVTWHLERLVRWVEDLADRGGGGGGDPAAGNGRMEVKKLGKSYGMVLEMMLEHAQMEERVVFPILDMADPGLSRTANEEHGRDLPIMNGIKEDIKSLVVMDSSTPLYEECLLNLYTRVKILLEHCREQFAAEERELLPLVEAVEMGKEQEEKVVQQCLDFMEATHSHLFPFFIQGLLPCDAMHYLDLIIACVDERRIASMLHGLVDEY